MVSMLTEVIQWKKITSGFSRVVLCCFVNIGFRYCKKHLQVCVVAVWRMSEITQITASVKMTTKMNDSCQRY